MYFSEWKKDDGYFECLLSFSKELTPVLRVRAVKESNPGTFSAIVRDFGGTGRMVKCEARMPLDDAKSKAKELAIQFIQESLQ